MRWQPDSEVCAECAFDWSVPGDRTIAIVSEVPDTAVLALQRIEDPTRRSGPRWSASMYLWHLVDVLRIGTKRLLTLTLDPERGIPSWDENELPDDRRYEQLSPNVGLIVIRSAAREWLTAANAATGTAVVQHPEFGKLGALDLVRRQAHEVQHHLLDINRSQ